MILKIYLIISVLAYIFFWLTMSRVVKIYKNENMDKELKNNKLGFVEHLRLVIIVLIPLVNIDMFLVYIYMFCFKDDNELLKIFLKNL